MGKPFKYGSAQYRIMGFGPIAEGPGAWGFGIELAKPFAEALLQCDRPPLMIQRMQEYAARCWPRFMPWLADHNELKDLWAVDAERCAMFHGEHSLVHSLNVPGQACGLDLCDGVMSTMRDSVTWAPHNVDSPGQAGALLSMWLDWFSMAETLVCEV